MARVFKVSEIFTVNDEPFIRLKFCTLEDHKIIETGIPLSTEFLDNLLIFFDVEDLSEIKDKIVYIDYGLKLDSQELPAIIQAKRNFIFKIILPDFSEIIRICDYYHERDKKIYKIFT